MSRLGGACPKLDWTPDGAIDRLEVWSESLTDAAAAVDYRRVNMKVRRGSDTWAALDAARLELAVPDKAAIAFASDRAESMIAEAQAFDARLVRRASWVRSCEGETACPALLLAGEENAFFERRRTSTADTASGEPVIVTVSTDSSEIGADALAAFIATVKLVQQFRPVHVIWQGAWLNAGGCSGFVFHVPLITGDMDFERLAFVINSKLRDRVSFAFMVRRAMSVTNRKWNSAQSPAERSYLAGSVDFVSHAGIDGDAESIAARACQWLGWESPWGVRYDDERASSSALCSWRAGEESMRAPSVPWVENPADRARWEGEERGRQAKREAARIVAERERIAKV